MLGTDTVDTTTLAVGARARTRWTSGDSRQKRLCRRRAERKTSCHVRDHELWQERVTDRDPAWQSGCVPSSCSSAHTNVRVRHARPRKTRLLRRWFALERLEYRLQKLCVCSLVVSGSTHGACRECNLSQSTESSTDNSEFSSSTCS